MMTSMGAAGTVGGVAATPSTDSVDHQSLNLATSAIQTDNTTHLYRANAGGSFTANGQNWSTLDNYRVAGEDETAAHGQPGTIDSSVPSGTPDQIWETERWDPSGGEEMEYEFSVPDGQQVEVRLYFYDGCTCTDATGERVFDVSVEGQTVLDDFDIIEKYSDQTGAMESFTVVSDGTVDVDFGHVTENPQINAIEIVSAEPQPDTLGGPGSTEFGAVVTDNSTTEQVTVTNLGESGDPSIDLTDISITGTDAGEFSAGAASQTTLAPGESAEIPVTFTPTSVDPKTATLEVSHSGSNSPLTVDLAGEGVSSVPVGFGSSQLDLSSVGVSSINNPTSVQFGPDGRLYVSQQDGTIYAFEVQRNGQNDYEATSAETITTIKNDVPNHNDNGDYNSNQIRQVTGITVTGTASQPVLYVSSSDWRIATGNTNPPSQSLDTNSGVISKLTQTSSGWDHTMLVRGLPRSEENHAPNGLALDEQNGVLYLAEGGHTNMGTPSNFFSNIPEYAYSGAILSIDLSEIESMSEKNASNTDVPYKYDLPTLAPGQTSTDGPFGGLDGDNMAVLEQDSPVQVYAPGFRNPYDVHLTEDGELYSVDNGPNGGLGGPPVQCTNEPQNSGTTYDDNLHHISEEGYYAGHPNPVRANDSVYPGAVYSGYDGSVECDYLVPGQEDGALATFGASTNGLTEYTASNFGGAMQGDLLTSSFDGNVYWMERNAQGDDLTEEPTPLLSSGGTLDVTAQGDGGPFPGTVWSAERTDNAIQVFEPNDYDSDGTQCDPSDPDGDADGDGYTNGDEQAVGTDPCSAGSVPADYDDDGNPDQLDSDDDNDGLSDSTDPFALDPENGLSTDLPVELDFSSTDTFANTIPATSGGTDGLGFTGLMTNGQDNYSELYNPDKVFAGGQANLLSVDEVPQGDAYQDQNDQQYAFQFGADTADVTEPFTVHTTVAGFPENPESAQSAGMFIGNGDQDNYLKLVVSATDGTGGVELAKENGGTFTNLAQPNNAGVTGSNQATDLYLTVFPGNNTVSASYSLDGGETMVPANVSASGSETGSATTTIPEGWLSSQDQGLAIGVISTSNFADSTFSATWDQLSVQYADGSVVADAGTDQVVDEGATVDLDASASTGDSLNYSWTETSGSGVQLSDADTATPTFTAPDVDAETTLTFEVAVSDGSTTDTDTVNVTVQDTDAADGELVYTVNAGGSEYNASDGTTYAADPTDALVGTSQTFSTSDWADSPPEIANTDEDPLYRTERYGTDFGYEIPVSANGTYEVTLQFAEIYQGTPPDTDTDADQTGQRVFDVTTEGQTVLDDYDIYAETGDSLTAIDETYTVEVTDGTLNVGFNATGDDAADNAKISAIKVAAIDDSGDNTAPAIDAIADQSVVSGENVNVSVSTSDDDGDSVSLSLSQSPEFVTLADGEISIDPQSDDAADSPYTVTVEANDGTDTTTESFEVTVETATSTTAGTVLDRVNVGGQTLSATDGSLNWTGVTGVTTDGPLVSTTGITGNYDGGDDVTPGSEVPSSTPSEVYNAERYGNMTWEFGVPSDSEVEVRLYLASQCPCTNEPGTRQYNVSIEGDQVLTEYDPVQDVGHANGTVKAFTTTEGGDGNVTITLTQGVIENPQVNAIEVVDVEGVNTPPTIDAISNQTVTEGDSASVPVNASDDDGDSVSLSLSQSPEFVTLADGEISIAPQSGDAADSPYSVEVVADDGTTTTTESFQVTVEESSTTGDVVYRINAGGPEVAATDDGPAWSGDTTNSPSPYVNVDGDNGVQTFSTTDAITLNESVPADTPSSLFQTERWDADTDGSTADDTEMQWTFPVQQGESYEVRLYLAEIAFESGSSSLPRTFDVTAEGDTKLNDYNIIQQYGHDTGAVETFTVTPTDGTIDLEFLHEQENPKVSAIEIVGPEPPTPDPETSADVTVTGGSSDTDSSTYGSGSFSVTNTGTEQIESVTFDLSSTALPDIVFDPEGTAGDESGKCFTADSGASETGLVTADGACSAPYSEPNNGVNGSDGYEVLTVEFGDFDPGETFTFSADLDPTSIKGAVDTQNTLAGPIGGNDMIGGTVAIESTNATVSNDLFTDGSAGGSQSSVTDSDTAAPSVGIDGVSLDTTTFDEHAAGGATVADAQQNVTVTGATPGETVTLLRMEGELNLDGVPEYDGSPGYDIEDYEANRILEIEEYTATADTNGEATFDVTLTESSDAGGLNYFVAAVGDSSQSGQVSQSVVLDYTPDDGPGPIGDFDAPTDPDGDGLYEDVNGDGSVNVGDAQALFANTDDPVVQNNADAFDFNDDGSVNVGDAQALFANGLEA